MKGGRLRPTDRGTQDRGGRVASEVDAVPDFPAAGRRQACAVDKGTVDKGTGFQAAGFQAEVGLGLGYVFTWGVEVGPWVRSGRWGPGPSGDGAVMGTGSWAGPPGEGPRRGTGGRDTAGGGDRVTGFWEGRGRGRGWAHADEDL